MQSINPFTNTLISSYTEFSKEKVSSIIEESDDFYPTWRSTSFAKRSKLFLRLADVLLENKLEYAQIITKEVGKPISQSLQEIEKCSLVCRYYAKNSESFLKDKVVPTDYVLSKIVYRPLGVILGIMPWNFPFWQVFRFAVPTLMAGNTVILKHASNVSGCSLVIDDAFKSAGFHKSAFSSLLTSGTSVKNVIQDDRIKGVSFTGSTDVGRQVAILSAQNLKKCLLELGGSDPYIVLEDADLPYAAKLCVESRLQNNGQSCIGAKRFIVADSVYDDFLKYIKQEINFYLSQPNDPSNLNCKLGPMSTVDFRNALLERVRLCEDMGAKVTYSSKPESGSAYLSPVIIENITTLMPAYKEEFFGPVISLFRFTDLDQAVDIANDTTFGLGSGVFGKNSAQLLDLAENRLNAGASFVNSYVKSNIELPFGGIKESGMGRELSREGLLEFVNIKTICVAE